MEKDLDFWEVEYTMFGEERRHIARFAIKESDIRKALEVALNKLDNDKELQGTGKLLSIKWLEKIENYG